MKTVKTKRDLTATYNECSSLPVEVESGLEVILNKKWKPNLKMVRAVNLLLRYDIDAVLLKRTLNQLKMVLKGDK